MVKIVAEIGVNHDGKIEKAIHLIDAAKKIGINTVKFQTYFTEELSLPDTPKVNYQKNNQKDDQTHYDMLKSLELSKEEFSQIFEYCKKCEIEFISTPYSISALDFLKKIGVKTIKISSADLVDDILLIACKKSDSDIILSTGMSSVYELDHAVSLLDINKLTLLQCVSNYPASDESINLSFIEQLKNYGSKVGFSDHSIGSMAAIMSISMKVDLIERHFTYDKNAKGPDHSASMDPKEFKNYLDDINRAIKIFGLNEKFTQKEEEDMKKISRKSIYFSKDLHSGHILKENDFVLRRPGYGLYANSLPFFIGKKLKQDIKKNQIVAKEFVQ